MNKNQLHECPKCHAELKYKNLRTLGLIIIFIIDPLITVLLYMMGLISSIVLPSIIVLWIGLYFIFTKKRHIYSCIKCDYHIRSDIQLHNVENLK